MHLAEKLALAEDILGHTFTDRNLLRSAITHPSAVEGEPVSACYERLEFLGDSILGSVVALALFRTYPDFDEGKLTRLKVSLVSGMTLSDVGLELGIDKIIVFGASETGTGARGLHSALENVYEAVVAALYLDAGLDAARMFVRRTLIPRMSVTLAREPENPKSALQEKLQEEGITPTYKLVETQGPPHDRTFVSQVFAGLNALASGMGRTKKEAESQAARSALDLLGFGGNKEEKARAKADREREKRERKEKKEQEKAAAKAAKRG